MAKTGHCGEVLIDGDKPKLYADLYYTTSRSGNTVTYSLGICMYLKSTGWRNNRWCCGITANGTNKGTNITVKKPTPNGGVGNYLGTTPFWANSTTAGAASHANTSTTTYVLSNQTTTVSNSATSIQVKVAFKETYHNYGWDGSSVSQDWGTKTFTVPIPAKYTVSYAKGNTTCSGSVSSQSKIEGTNLTLQSSGFTKSNYTLIGWSINNDNSTVDYSLGGTYSANKSITLYPVWKSASSSGSTGGGSATTYYSMTIDPNGGKMKKPGRAFLFIPVIKNDTSQHIIEYSSEGYLPICTNSSSVFDNRDGDDGGVPAAYYPNQPVKDGYTFSSWKSSDGTTYTSTLVMSGHSMWYVSDHNKKKDFTVTAQWIPNVYTMTVNPNGGTMHKGDGTTSSAFTSKFAYNAPTYIGQETSTNSIYNNVPWRTGYQFVKWQVTSGGGSAYKNDAGEFFFPPGNYDYEDGGYTGTSHWVFDGKYVGNVIITAQWEGNIYYINYHPNGGSGTMAHSELTYGTSSNLRKNTFTRTGYSFIGWSTNSSATTATYSDQQSVFNLTTALEEEIVLYAVWKKDVLTVNFNSNSPNGATNTVLSQSFTYGASGNRFGYNTNGTKKWPQTEKSYADQFGFGNQYYYGYKIIGWSTNVSATEPTFDVYATVSDDWIDANVSTSSGATINLYAVWDYNGLVRIYYDDAWHMALPYVYDGSTWQQTLPYVRKNNDWKLGI